MCWDPAMHGPGHTFLLAKHPLAIGPGKADYLTERMADSFRLQQVG